MYIYMYVYIYISHHWLCDEDSKHHCMSMSWLSLHVAYALCATRSLAHGGLCFRGLIVPEIHPRIAGHYAGSDVVTARVGGWSVATPCADLRRKAHSESESATIAYHTAQHSTIQHAANRRPKERSAAQHSTAQHSTAQHSAAAQSRAQQSRAEHSAAEQSTAQHKKAQHSTRKHSTAKRSAALQAS